MNPILKEHLLPLGGFAWLALIFGGIVLLGGCAALAPQNVPPGYESTVEGPTVPLLGKTVEERVSRSHAPLPPPPQPFDPRDTRNHQDALERCTNRYEDRGPDYCTCMELADLRNSPSYSAFCSAPTPTLSPAAPPIPQASCPEAEPAACPDCAEDELRKALADADKQIEACNIHSCPARESECPVSDFEACVREAGTRKGKMNEWTRKGGSDAKAWQAVMACLNERNTQ